MKPPLLLVSLLATAVALLAAEEPSERATATGIWRWTFTMPDGTKVEVAKDEEKREGSEKDKD